MTKTAVDFGNLYCARLCLDYDADFMRLSVRKASGYIEQGTSRHARPANTARFLSRCRGYVIGALSWYPE
jgi:hypothetical protein